MPEFGDAEGTRHFPRRPHSLSLLADVEMEPPTLLVVLEYRSLCSSNKAHPSHWSARRRSLSQRVISTSLCPWVLLTAMALWGNSSCVWQKAQNRGAKLWSWVLSPNGVGPPRALSFQPAVWFGSRSPQLGLGCVRRSSGRRLDFHRAGPAGKRYPALRFSGAAGWEDAPLVPFRAFVLKLFPSDRAGLRRCLTALPGVLGAGVGAHVCAECRGQPYRGALPVPAAPVSCWCAIVSHATSFRTLSRHVATLPNFALANWSGFLLAV